MLHLRTHLNYQCFRVSRVIYNIAEFFFFVITQITTPYVNIGLLANVHVKYIILPKADILLTFNHNT